MMLFKIESKHIAYDEDISMVILAETEEAAIKLAVDNWSFRDDKDKIEFIVTSIDQTKEQIIDISHYGD